MSIQGKSKFFASAFVNFVQNRQLRVLFGKPPARVEKRLPACAAEQIKSALNGRFSKPQAFYVFDPGKNGAAAAPR